MPVQMLDGTQQFKTISFEEFLQGSKFASAVSKCQGFCQGISMFFSICLSRKNAEAIK